MILKKNQLYPKLVSLDFRGLSTQRSSGNVPLSQNNQCRSKFSFLFAATLYNIFSCLIAIKTSIASK